MDVARNLMGRINVGDSLTRTAAARPGQLAVVDGARRFSYADFNAYVNRELLPAGETGEIVYRGPSTMSGYLRDDEATDKAFAHGWFHSGDIGRFGDDGVLWFTDRFKDAIKTGGENVASIEVEKAVYAADPRVAEVVVVGLPHQRWSEAITAVMVPKPGETIDPAELIAALKTRLDGFKAPKSVIVVDQLPKTSTGKIQKNVVRSDHAAHYAISDGG